MITARGLTRTFTTKDGPIEAVRNVDLDVAPGEIVGLLGPNGAGKTTTLRMLATLLDPTSGTVTIAGHELATDPVAVRRSIGYVAQGNSALNEAIVMDELVLQARLFGVARDVARQRAETLLDALDLPGVERRTYGSLSGGQRRRVDIVGGLIHQPTLVILDEPTTGLDPQSRANLWDHIRSLRDQGATILLTTHYLDEADALCDRVLIMDHGAILADGTPGELKARIGGDVIAFELDVTEPDLVDAAAKSAASAAANAVDSTDVHIDGGTVSLTVDRGNEAVAPVLRSLDAAGIAPTSVTIKRPSLDDVFLTLTGRTLRDDTAHTPAQEGVAA
jgi:ABC-2 type transport system ATP-binding protein